MSTTTCVRDAAYRTRLVAFQTLVRRGMAREEILLFMGISRKTYYRFLARLNALAGTPAVREDHDR